MTAARLASAALAWVIAGSVVIGLGSAQRGPSEREIRLRFPDRIDLAGLSIRYFLVGPFGGYGTFFSGERDVREYAIATAHEGKQAQSLKAIIYCPGYAFELLTESSLPLRRLGVVSIDLKPVRWLPVSGRVDLPPESEALTIEAVYTADWSLEFFGIIDGAAATFTVAKSAVGRGGTFTLDVPDLASDPVVTRFPDGWRRGALRLILRGAQTGNIWPSIRQTGRVGFELPIASKYPQDLSLPGLRR